MVNISKSPFHIIEWSDLSNDKEPDNLKELYAFLFIQGEKEIKKVDITPELINAMHYYANKLTVEPYNLNNELLQEGISIATLFVFAAEYKQANFVLSWLAVDSIIERNIDNNQVDGLISYLFILKSYIKKALEIYLTNKELKVFHTRAGNNLGDTLLFSIGHREITKNINIEITDLFAWVGEVLLSHAKILEEQLNVVNCEDLFKNFLDEYMYCLSMVTLEDNLLLSEVIERIFSEYPNNYFKAAYNYSLSLYNGSKTDIKKYFKAITRKTLENNEYYIQKHINRALDSVLQDNEKLIVYLKEITNKKYLISLLDFTWKLERNFQVESVFEALIKLKEYRFVLTIFEEWLNEELQKKIIESGNYGSFEVAFSYSECALQMKAKEIYEAILEKNPNSTSVINNLSVIYYQELKDYDKALSLLEVGNRIDPEEEFINRNIKTVKELIEQKEKRPSIIKDRYFKKIDKPQRSILFTIYKFSTADDDAITYELLGKVSSISNEKYLKSSIKQLVDLELISYSDEKGYVLDDVVYKLIQDFKDPKLERQIVKASNNKLYRPIFFHESEINLYRVLLELFPQQLVFPNMDLKAIIDVDKIRDYIDSDIIEYLFKAHVDFAVISSVTYLPILAIEKDSDYQDKSYNSTNASRKNIIFQTSGLPLIRIRFNSAMDTDRLKEEVRLATKDLLLQIKQNSDPNEILKEFNLKVFGIHDSPPDVDEIREKWEQFVGETIYQETRDILLNTDNAVVQILLSKSVQPIIEFGLQQIKESLYETFPMINAIQINYV